MKKLIAILLCAGMMLSFAGCQSGDESPSDTNNNEMNQESSVTEDEVEQQPEEEQVELNEYGMPMAADNMLSVAMALVVTDMETELEYAVWNNDFIWTACSMIVSTGVVGGDNIDGYVYVSADVVKQCINAMFAGFDANTDAIPELSENVGVVYDEEADKYGFPVGDFGDQSLKVIEWNESGSNGISMKVAMFSLSEDKQISGTYELFMNGTTLDDEKAIFDYMYTSFVKVSSAPNNVELGDDSISESEALAMIETKYGKDGEAEPDTGNVVGYGYEGITTIDGVNYHNFRMTWLVMNEDGTPDHSSYLQNIFVSEDGSIIKEGFRGSDGWEFVED